MSVTTYVYIISTYAQNKSCIALKNSGLNSWFPTWFIGFNSLKALT